MLIHICGIDGSGKTTLIKRLSQYYDDSTCVELSSNVEFVNQVNEICKKNNSNRWIEFNNKFRSMIWANEIINVVPQINNYLEQKKIVLIDRYIICNKIYSQLEDDSPLQLINFIHESLPKPDFAIYLNIDPLVATERINNRGLKRSPKESEENLRKASEMYKYELSKVDYPVRVLDASKAQEEVFLEAIKEIETQKAKAYQKEEVF